MLLTDRPDDDLGDDVLARVARGRVIAPEPWALVQDLFGARRMDPRLSHERWLGEALLEAAPAGMDVDEVGHAMASVPGVAEVHDLHVWTIGSGFPALSAHVLVRAGADEHEVRAAVAGLLAERFAVEHCTLQTGPAPGVVLIRPAEGP